jgi:O-antigen/teichoic acid export membrane protein
LHFINEPGRQLNGAGSRGGGGEVCQVEEFAAKESERTNDAAWVAKNTFLTLGGSLAGRGLQAGGQIALARLFGPATFGLYTIGWALLRVANVIAPLGLNNGVIHCATRYVTTDHWRLGRVLRQSVVLAILFGGFIGLMMCIAAPALAHRVYDKNDLVPLICLFAAGVPLAAGLRVASASTQVSQTMRYSVYAETLTQPAANLALIFGFYVVGWRLFGAATAAVVSFGIGLAVALYYQWHLFPRVRVQNSPRPSAVSRELLQFSLMAGLGTTFSNLVPLMDRLFVGAYLMPAEVGTYQAAAQASVMLGIVAGTFNSVVGPRISLLHQSSQTERLEQVYKVATKWVVYASIPCLLVVCSTPRKVLGALYGASYMGGAGPLIILSIMWLTDALAGPAAILLIYTAHQKLYSFITGVELALCVALNYLLIPRFGAVGAALATCLASTTMMLAFLLGVRAKAGIWPFDWRWAKGIMAAAATVGLLMLVSHLDAGPAIWDVLFRLTLSAAIFAGGLFFLGLDPEDHEMIGMLKRYLVTFVHPANSGETKGDDFA